MKSFGALVSLAVALAEPVDEATYLLQLGNKQRSQETEGCYVKGGCHTTTTTTTTTRTRPTRPPTTTASWGEVVVDTPPGGGETDQPKYCGPEGSEFTKENLRRATVNNLGGMGPGTGRTRTDRTGLRGSGRWAGEEVIAYECGIKKPDGTCVDVVISAANSNYKDAHKAKRGEHFSVTRKRDEAVHKFGRSSEDFIAAYNGDKRSNVIGIGALVPGEYKFKFSFYDKNKNPVEVDYLPMTFYDLDGKDDLGGGLRYEEAYTSDAEGLVAFAHPTLEGVNNLEHNCEDGVCKVQSVTQEVEIPTNFDTLSDDEKSAAATFLFAHKSSIELTYNLNHGHRVFLFKGSKSLYCDEIAEEP